MKRWITLKSAAGSLFGSLALPNDAAALILIAHSHPSPRDEALADYWITRGFAVMSMGLLTEHELGFADAAHNVPRLTQRLIDTMNLIRQDVALQRLKLGIYASSALAPAAIRAAARRDAQVMAVVCDGGQIDQAGAQSLDLLSAPLLLLHTPDDEAAPAGWLRASHHLQTDCSILELQAGDLPDQAAADWFSHHLRT